MKTEVQVKFDSYPEHIKPLILYLRELVFSIAEDLDAANVEESLKWGEPSYQVKGGSPVRMDWKENIPISITFSSIAKRNSLIHYNNHIKFAPCRSLDARASRRLCGHYAPLAA